MRKREAEDRDRDAQTGASPVVGARRRRLRVGLDELVEVARRRAVDALERVLDDPRDLEEADAPVEERGDRDLVRGVERAGVRAAALARLAREPREAGSARGPAARTRASAPAARSSCGTDVARRSGYVSAKEIGTRMSG